MEPTKYIPRITKMFNRGFPVAATPIKSEQHTFQTLLEKMSGIKPIDKTHAHINDITSKHLYIKEKPPELGTSLPIIIEEEIQEPVNVPESQLTCVIGDEILNLHPEAMNLQKADHKAGEVQKVDHKAEEVQNKAQQAGKAQKMVIEAGMQNKAQQTEEVQNIAQQARELQKFYQRARKKPEFRSMLERLKTKPDVVAECIPLMCERGTRLVEKGYDLLQFYMPGSGYLYMPQMHKNRSGEPEYTKEKMIAKSILKGLQHVVLPLSAQVDSFGKTFALAMGTQFVKEFIQNLEQAKERDKAQMDVFGTKVTLPNGKILEYARKKVDGHKTQYTIAGPSDLNIMGNYTTMASRQYMLTLASYYLEERFKEAIQNNDEILKAPICLTIEGHSRGAVTSAEGAAMISRWIKDEYPQFYNSVKLEIIQFDPVPGSDTNYSVAKMIDFRTKGSDGTGRFDSRGVKYAALNDSAQTTVVYSARTQYPHCFTPQIVKGADRIIITPYDHSVGLRNIDTNRILNGAGGVIQEAHRQVFVDRETQTAYTLGALNGLARGVYILREDNELERVPSIEAVEHYMDEYYKDVRVQRKRCEAIKESARDFFARLKEGQ